MVCGSFCLMVWMFLFDGYGFCIGWVVVGLFEMGVFVGVVLDMRLLW